MMYVIVICILVSTFNTPDPAFTGHSLTRSGYYNLYLLMVPVLSNTPLVTVGPEVQAHTGAIVILPSQLQTTSVSPPLPPPPAWDWSWALTWCWRLDLWRCRTV